MSIGELPRALGRYDVFDQIAAGGMATVHFGRMHGAVGFQRVVAIKRLHSHYAHDAHFVDMFLDEARLASRLKHPNVISTLDVVADETEVFLVMEFVLGESLEALMPRHVVRSIPVRIVAAIVCNVLEGLHGAHEARSDFGEPLGIVHRDVSPTNVLVGEDGVARVFDFGIAKAAINTQETREGVIKGKVTYMAPEQVMGPVDRRADVYAAGVILWELLVGRRRHAGERNDALFMKLATNSLAPLPAASELRIDVPEALDRIIARATMPDPEHRFESAREMAMAIEEVVHPALTREVAVWVREVAGQRIEQLADVMKRIESDTQPRSEPSLPAMSHPSTGSVRVVTSSLTRAGGVASSVPPYDASASSDNGSGPPTRVPPRRNWTMAMALLAFAAGMVLVGLRLIINHGASAERSDAMGAAAISPPDVPQAPPVVIAPAPPALTALEAAAPRPSAVTVPPPSPRAAQPQWQPARPAHVAPQPATPAPVTPTTAAPAANPPAATTHKPNCDSPFMVGTDGIRQIKPECM